MGSKIFNYLAFSFDEGLLISFSYYLTEFYGNQNDANVNLTIARLTVGKSVLINAITNAKNIMENTVISIQGGSAVSKKLLGMPDIMSAAKASTK